MTHLIVTHEDNDVDEFRFDPDHSPITLGRRTSNDVCIASPSVSGIHAKISLDGNGAWIEDLNSTNGTFINGRLISRRRLEHGDDIAIGKARVTWLGWTSGTAPGTTRNPGDEQAEGALAAIHQVEEAVGADSEDPLQPYAEHLSARDTSADSMESADTVSPAPRRRYDDRSDQGETQSEGSEPHERHDEKEVDLAVAVRPTRTNPATSSVIRPEASTDIPAESQAHPRADAGTDTREFVASDASVDPTPDQPIDEHAPHIAEAAPTTGEPAEQPEDDPLFDVILGKAAIEIRNGAKSGQTLIIDKPVTTLGRPGIQIAAIMRKPDGYFLMHVESDDSVERPTLNKDAIGDDPVPLRSGDELKVAGVDVQFRLS